jgi:hypothetical protein
MKYLLPFALAFALSGCAGMEYQPMLHYADWEPFPPGFQLLPAYPVCPYPNRCQQ